MTGMLQPEPTHRLSLSEVIRHPWFNGETPTKEEVWQEFQQRRLVREEEEKKRASREPPKAPTKIFVTTKVKRSRSEVLEEDETEANVLEVSREVRCLNSCRCVPL